MTLYLTVFTLFYGAIFLRAFQQKNVAFSVYALVLPTSIALGFFEVYALANAVLNASPMVALSAGLGGGCGTLTAMWLHRNYVPAGKSFKRKK